MAFPPLPAETAGMDSCQLKDTGHPPYSIISCLTEILYSSKSARSIVAVGGAIAGRDDPKREKLY
jgi:hypothetical protein